MIHRPKFRVVLGSRSKKRQKEGIGKDNDGGLGVDRAKHGSYTVLGVVGEARANKGDREYLSPALFRLYRLIRALLTNSGL